MSSHDKEIHGMGPPPTVTENEVEVEANTNTVESEVLRELRTFMTTTQAYNQEVLQQLNQLNANQMQALQMQRSVVSGIYRTERTVHLLLEETRHIREKLEADQATSGNVSRILLLNGCFDSGTEQGLVPAAGGSVALNINDDVLPATRFIKTEPGTAAAASGSETPGQSNHQTTVYNPCGGTTYHAPAMSIPIGSIVAHPQQPLQASTHGGAGPGGVESGRYYNSGQQFVSNGSLGIQQNYAQAPSASYLYPQHQRPWVNSNNKLNQLNQQDIKPLIVNGNAVNIKLEKEKNDKKGNGTIAKLKTGGVPLVKPGACQYCNRTFYYNHSLVLHARSCKKRYESLAKHMAAKKDDVKNNVPAAMMDGEVQLQGSTSADVEKMINCNYCERLFPTQHQVTSHERVHTGERPYNCYVCKIVFAHAGNMIKHMKSKHPDCNAYTCRLCKVSFKTHAQVLSHRKECKVRILERSKSLNNRRKEDIQMIQIIPKHEGNHGSSQESSGNDMIYAEENPRDSDVGSACGTDSASEGGGDEINSDQIEVKKEIGDLNVEKSALEAAKIMDPNPSNGGSDNDQGLFKLGLAPAN